MILVHGTVCLDRIRHVSRLPMLGEYVEVDSEAGRLGGEAANTAAHLRRWGAEVRLVGNLLGADEAGQILRSMLEERGFCAELQAAVKTPVCDVYVTPDGERTMFGLGFSTMVPPAADALSPGDWVTTDANLGDAGLAFVWAARQAGMRAYLMDTDPNGTAEAGAIWQSGSRWYGVRGDTAANIQFVGDLVDRNQCSAILTDSGRGFCYASPGSPARHFRPFPRAETRDSTGAGDAFRAGMLFGLDGGWPPLECLRFAAAASALAGTYVGAAEGPEREEVEAHIAANSEVASQYA